MMTTITQLLLDVLILIWLVFSFMTEGTSVSLNVALGAVCEKSDTQAMAGEGSQGSCNAFGFPGAIVSPSLHSGFLKGLKYCNGSYTASLSPV